MKFSIFQEGLQWCLLELLESMGCPLHPSLNVSVPSRRTHGGSGFGGSSTSLPRVRSTDPCVPLLPMD